MEKEQRLGLGTTRFKEIVYASDNILSIKKMVHESYSSVPIEINNEVCQLANLKGMETLLDIGCGTGDFLIHLRKNRNHTGILFGVDLNSGVFIKNKTISQTENLDINFLEANILKLPFETESVEFITALHMLSHVPIDLACDEVKRVLKKDGKFIATANSLQSYPHVDKYRKMAFKMMGWGSPIFTTSSFNLENMEKKLLKSWDYVNIFRRKGELKIPNHEFLKYFYSNMMIWEPMPTKNEIGIILDMVSKAIINDTKEGFIIEPKYVGIAICQK